jgi:hypothetical protein
MPAHTLIDPFIVAVPSQCSPEDFEEYCRTISGWSAAIERNVAGYSISETVISRLWNEGRYPTFENIGRLIAAYGITSVTAYDLLNRTRVLGGQRPYLEDRTGISSVLVDTETGVTPATLCERVGQFVGVALHDSIFLACAAVQRGWDIEDLWFATTGGVEHSTIIVRGEILEVCSGEDVSVEVLPVSAEIDMHLRPPEDLIPEDILQVADVPAQAANWIYAGLPAHERVQYPMRPVTAGPEFVESMRSTGILRSRALAGRVYRLAVMAATGRIMNVLGADLHPVRVNIAADADQVVRSDGASLWRCKVSQSGAGFRLHYWRLATGGIELDRVLTESEV